MINFILLISRQGKTRLKKWFVPCPERDQFRTIKEVSSLILNRSPKVCNFLEWRDYKLCYKRYASLFFIACIEQNDNELLALEMVHHFVECLDRYFGNVCELDLIFNFHKAYYILDEILISGELQESSKRAVLHHISEQDAMMQENEHGHRGQRAAAAVATATAWEVGDSDSAAHGDLLVETQLQATREG